VGRSYDVRYPDEALVLATRVNVALRESPESEFPQHVERLPLAEIVRIEVLQGGSPQESS